MERSEHRDRGPANRLAKEISPYLLQHAHNPVDWYPWGEEALARSRSEDRPILLSVGYSACHWCHVMERESFEDASTAEVMNRLFVNIKVDREERPDLDQIYQMVVQIMGRSGGWPLTVFLTPALKPFFGGTYFPPTDRYGMPSFRAVLEGVSKAYTERRREIEESASELTRVIGDVMETRGAPEDPPLDVIERAANTLARRFDETHGGFGDAPKFPNTMNLDVFLRAYRRHGHEPSLARALKTLDAMREGGIWDHLGGGFHRYATDARWRIPHFEKMLYDNALLARLYVDAWRITKDERYASTARHVLDYVLREMRAPFGGFYSTQDADSEGEEGKFFAWTPEQVAALLGPEDAKVINVYFGISDGGNFEHGTTVLHQSRSRATTARQTGRTEQEVGAVIDRARGVMFEAREKRPKPFRDEKIIASWNGLMIGAFAEAGAAFGEPRYIDAARTALAFVRSKLWSGEQLLRIYKDEQARIPAFLEDYANVAGAALDIYEATTEADALEFADALMQQAIRRFADTDHGGFFFAGGDTSDLVVRTRDNFDNAVPSGTSSACHALLRLHAMTGREELLDHAERTLRSLSAQAIENPFGFGHLLGALERYVYGGTDVLVVGEVDDPATAALLAEGRRAYLPNRTLVLVAPDAPPSKNGPTALLENRRMQDGKATAYVCAERACSLPVTEPAALRELIARN